MKLFFAIIIAIGAVPSDKDGAVLSFYEDTYSFPDTKEGVQLTTNFEYENTGNKPLIFSNYKVACSCTKAILPKDPILPGQKGKIKVTFDTNDKYGYQSRVIAIHSNAKKSITKLKIKVVVIPKNNQKEE